MIGVPIDLPGLRRNLDVQWMTGIWVGRLDESDGHEEARKDSGQDAFE